MTPTEACALIYETTKTDYGKFYGPLSKGSALGVGQIFSSINYPLINTQDGLFDTYQGNVYILTHECDIDQANKRPYNDYLLICPIIPLETVVKQMVAISKDKLINFLKDLANDQISRVCYLPPVEDSFLPYGGIVYMNQISSTHVSQINKEESESVVSLSHYGLRLIDYKLTNHLLRPKSASLPLRKY